MKSENITKDALGWAGFEPTEIQQHTKLVKQAMIEMEIDKHISKEEFKARLGARVAVSILLNELADKYECLLEKEFTLGDIHKAENFLNEIRR